MGSAPLPLRESVPHGYPPRITAKYAVPQADCGHGSGRFCGTRPDQRLVQKSDHPRDDCHIRKVEDVPVEVEALRRDVEQEKIGDRAISQSINCISDRSADNEAEGHGGEARGRSGQPDPEQNARNCLEREKRPWPQGPFLGNQAVTDPLIPGEDEIEEGSKRPPCAPPEIGRGDQAKLCRLVHHWRRHSYRQSEQRERAPEAEALGGRRDRSVVGVCCHSAALRMISHSRKARASRGETSG